MRPDRAAWVRLTAPEPPFAPRPREAVVADVEAARASGAADLLLGGGEPTRSPDLLEIVRHARSAGLNVALVTDGQALTSERRLDALHAAGVRHVAVRLLAPEAARHDAVAGPGTHARALTALRLLAGHALSGAVLAVLDEGSTTDVDAFVDLTADLGLALRLVRRVGPGPDHEPPPPPSVVEALDRAWRRAAVRGVQLDVDAFAAEPAPVVADAEPPLLDRNLAELFDRGFVPPSAATGVRVVPPDGRLDGVRGAVERGGPLRQLAPSLAAAGLPPVDLPACLGGLDRSELSRSQQTGCAPCPRADRCAGVPLALQDLVTVRPPPIWTPPLPRRIAVLHPWLPDQLLAASVLPALARALHARGVPTDLLGRWDLPWDPHDLRAPIRHSRARRAWTFIRRTITREPDPLLNYRAPEGRLGHPFRGADGPERAHAIDEAFWRDLDLSAYDLVIAPGWDAGARAFEHPTFRADARLIVADFHMLVGAEPWMRRRNPAGALPKHGAWWPGDRVHVHACFPRFQGLYRALGIPLDQILWRPYPLWLPHVPLGPDPASCEAIFSGGRHARAFATLEEAARRLRGRVRPIRMHADPAAVRAEPPLELLGMAELPVFVETIRTSRFVVLPLRHDAVHAAGISVIALALAAGRPVIATRTPATLDHLRHDVDAILVEPDDPASLADAIARLDRDDALLARLAAGARASAAKLSVEAWATEILHGVPPRPPQPAPGAAEGTRYAW